MLIRRRGRSGAQVDVSVAAAIATEVTNRNAAITAHIQALPKRAASYYDNTIAIAGVTSAGFVITANRLLAVPFYVPEAVTIARIAINVTAFVTGGARFGVYAMLSTGLPGALIATLGTVDTNSNAFKELSGLTQVLAPGVLPYVWLAVESDVGPTVAGYTAQGALLGTDGGSPYGHCYVAHTYGALPDPFGTPVFATTAPRIQVKTA